MKKIFIILLFSYIKFFVPESLFAQYNLKDFKDLYTLSGTWEMRTKNGFLYESWIIQNDSLLRSHSFRIKNNDTIPEETIELIFSNGNLRYIPTVINQNQGKPVIFTLMKINNKRFVFENLSHDFPQRIIYNLKKQDSLLVIINGKTSKGYKEILFPFCRK
jgi:hypothetical protein